MRKALHANDTLVVHPGGQWPTVQAAFNHVRGCLDLCGHTITLYSDSPITDDLTADGVLVGGGIVRVDAPAWVDGTVVALNGARLGLAGIQLTGVQLYADGGRIDFTDLTFGPSDRPHIEARNGGHVESRGHYAIAGGAVAHLHAVSGGRILLLDGGGWLTEGLTFGEYFAGCAGGNITFGSNFAYHGQATGRRYYVHKGGLIDTLGRGEDFLPGDTPGVSTVGSSSGWYT